MTTGVSYFFTTMLIVTIFVFLWRARNEAFAQIGNGWGIILSGLASLSFGEISRLVLLILVNQERMSAASAEILGDLAYTAIFVGVLVVAIGIYLWLPTVKELTIESATVKKNNNDLRERASNDGMLLSTIPAALYHTSGSLTANTSEIVFVNDKIEELLGYSRADFEAAAPAVVSGRARPRRAFRGPPAAGLQCPPRREPRRSPQQRAAQTPPTRRLPTC